MRACNATVRKEPGSRNPDSVLERSPWTRSTMPLVSRRRRRTIVKVEQTRRVLMLYLRTLRAVRKDNLVRSENLMYQVSCIDHTSAPCSSSPGAQLASEVVQHAFKSDKIKNQLEKVSNRSTAVPVQGIQKIGCVQKIDLQCRVFRPLHVPTVARQFYLRLHVHKKHAS